MNAEESGMMGVPNATTPPSVNVHAEKLWKMIGNKTISATYRNYKI